MPPGSTPRTQRLYRISQARQSQDELLSSSRKCSISSAVAEALDRTAGDQLRIQPVSSDAGAAAYTIHEIHEDARDIRMGKQARKRVGHEQPFDGFVSGEVPRSDLSFTTTWEYDDVCETIWDAGQDNLLVCAPHAGDIESNTAQAAAIVRKSLGIERASAWFIHGFGENAFDRWHITTSEMSPASYPGLRTLANRKFDRAVSFHVHDRPEIEIGGLASREHRTRLGEEIHDAVDGTHEVVTDRSNGKHMARTERNVVNWLTVDNAGGVQIEMPPRIALRYRKRVARAVAAFYDT